MGCSVNAFLVPSFLSEFDYMPLCKLWKNGTRLHIYKAYTSLQNTTHEISTCMCDLKRFCVGNTCAAINCLELYSILEENSYV